MPENYSRENNSNQQTSNNKNSQLWPEQFRSEQKRLQQEKPVRTELRLRKPKNTEAIGFGIFLSPVT